MSKTVQGQTGRSELVLLYFHPDDVRPVVDENTDVILIARPGEGLSIPWLENTTVEQSIRYWARDNAVERFEAEHPEVANGSD